MKNPLLKPLLALMKRGHKMFSDQQRQRMADIVNDALHGTEFEQVVGPVSLQDFSPVDRGQFIWQSTVSGGRDTLLKAFATTARDRRDDRGQFYHFLKYDYAMASVQQGSLQHTAMTYFEKNDHAEYAEFLRRCGFWMPFVNGTVNKDKTKLFVLCLTNSSRQQRFWSEYADNDQGVCLCLRLVSLDPHAADLWDLRDVVYDDGYRFDFINEIRYWFEREFARELIVEGIDKFARFYKRAKYSWENESRISFDYRLQQGLPTMFPESQDRDSHGNITREYISVPLSNQLYTLQIDEIICGGMVSDQRMEDLRLAAGLDQAQVWRRRV
jgi:hypothetical protein